MAEVNYEKESSLFWGDTNFGRVRLFSFFQTNDKRNQCKKGGTGNHETDDNG